MSPKSLTAGTLFLCQTSPYRLKEDQYPAGIPCLRMSLTAVNEPVSKSNPREGDFLFSPLFVGLLSLRGDALFGGPFSSWQVASSRTSPASDKEAAAPDVDVPPPFALSGASPSLHVRHEEQRFLFLLESFEWLHRWHGHNEARRVADRRSSI